MGDRAVLALASNPKVGVYLHWDGSPDSVQKILAEVQSRQYRTPGNDPTYALARLIGVCHERIGQDTGLSLGVGALSCLDCDNGDNGLYWIGNDWEITDREYTG